MKAERLSIDICSAPLLPASDAPSRSLTEELLKGKDSGVLFPGFIEDADLPALYAGADCFIFPSRYEGFGLPPLEAQACGQRRILASDAPALKEVLGDTALFFKNGDRAALKKALLKVQGWDGAGAEEIRRNLSRFQWERTAKRLWKELKGNGQGNGR